MVESELEIWPKISLRSQDRIIILLILLKELLGKIKMILYENKYICNKLTSKAIQLTWQIIRIYVR
jgi:hypothetical protein